MEELSLQISGVTEKDGKKQAHICFRGDGRYAEGTIPDCVLSRCEGFSEEEKEQLIRYLRENLTELKRTAARINPLHAILNS